MQTIQDILQYPSARLRQYFHLVISTMTLPISVESYQLEESFNETYKLNVTVTSPEQDIDGALCVGRRATWTLDEEATIPSKPGLVEPVVESARIVHGVVTEWERVKATRDQAIYKLCIEPRVALLDHIHDSAVFHNTTLKDLIAGLIIDKKLFDSFDLEFALQDTKERFEQTVMYEESVWNFISRHCRRAGVFWYFKQGSKSDVPRRDTIVFGDNPSVYERALEVPLMPDSGLGANWHEAILTISTVRKLVPEAIGLWEHNYRAPHDTLKVDARVARDDRSLFGMINRSTEHHHNPEFGKALVTVRRDELISRQTLFKGTSNVIGMRPGMVVRLTNHELPGAKYGIVITKVVMKGNRTEPAFVEFEGTPSHLTWRPEYIPEKHWRWVAGTIPAFIAAGDNAPYAPLDEYGRYPVRPQFLRQSGTRGTDLLSLRLLRPSASYQGGFHAPLLSGTEVRLSATNGDIDRLFISGALHDFTHPDTVHGLSRWPSRSVWRSPLLGVKFRMEDRKGQESAKIATVHLKSSVGLGYLVDSQKRLRGEGFEAWTLGHAVIRGVRGMLLSADSQDNPNVSHLEMRAALEQLQSALAEAEALRADAQRASAELAQVKAQQALLESGFKDLQKAVILLSAPDGIGAVTRSSIQLAAGEHLAMNAGSNADLSVGDNLTAAAGGAVSFFAQKKGIKALAANGNVDIQAQSGELQMFAEHDMKVASADGNLTVLAGKSIIISDGAGAYIKLQGGNIEIGCPGSMTSHAASFPRLSPSSLQQHFQSMKRLGDLHVGYLNADEQPITAEALNLLKGDGSALKLTTGADGRASVIQTVFAPFKAHMPQRLEGSDSE